MNSIPPPRVAKIRRMWREGYKVGAIATDMGIDRREIMRVLVDSKLIPLSLVECVEMRGR